MKRKRKRSGRLCFRLFFLNVSDTLVRNNNMPPTIVMASPRRLATLALLAGPLLLCVGCASGPRFTRERFDTVYVHSPAEEVRAKLGTPQRTTAEYWDYLNTKPTHYGARIWFRDGQVAKKKWFEGPDLPKEE